MKLNKILSIFLIGFCLVGCGFEKEKPVVQKPINEVTITGSMPFLRYSGKTIPVISRNYSDGIREKVNDELVYYKCNFITSEMDGMKQDKYNASFVFTGENLKCTELRVRYAGELHEAIFANYINSYGDNYNRTLIPNCEGGYWKFESGGTIECVLDNKKYEGTVIYKF